MTASTGTTSPGILEVVDDDLASSLIHDMETIPALRRVLLAPAGHDDIAMRIAVQASVAAALAGDRIHVAACTTYLRRHPDVRVDPRSALILAGSGIHPVAAVAIAHARGPERKGGRGDVGDPDTRFRVPDGPAVGLWSSLARVDEDHGITVGIKVPLSPSMRWDGWDAAIRHDDQHDLPEAIRIAAVGRPVGRLIAHPALSRVHAAIARCEPRLIALDLQPHDGTVADMLSRTWDFDGHGPRTAAAFARRIGAAYAAVAGGADADIVYARLWREITEEVEAGGPERTPDRTVDQVDGG